MLFLFLAANSEFERQLRGSGRERPPAGPTSFSAPSSGRSPTAWSLGALTDREKTLRVRSRFLALCSGRALRLAAAESPAMVIGPIA